MNVQRLEHIAEIIQSRPFDMDCFSRETSCGTAHCIGGWAQEIWDWDSDYCVSLPGQNALGLTDVEADRLFYVDQWPEQFTTELTPDKPETSSWSAITPATAAARIRHFIATEGRE